MRRLLLSFLFLAFAGPAAATIPLQMYRAELIRIDAALARDDRAVAAAIAASLITEQVSWDGGSMSTDRSILTPLVQNDRTVGTLEIRRRLASTIAALSAARPAGSRVPEDRALLERIAESRKPDALERGGEIATLPVGDEGLLAEVARRLGLAWEWVVSHLVSLWDWILSFWPSSPKTKPSSWSFFSVPVTVTVLVLVIVAVLLILAIEIWRRGRRVGAAVVQSDAVKSNGMGDDDPLSRETGEWERYAVELAAAGRIRESIRAWYHAVLVAMFRAGMLRYRKGRTNWEYVSALPPTVPWRSSFTLLTRLFDHEWYGRDRSLPETLESCAARSRSLIAAIRGERESV